MESTLSEIGCREVRCDVDVKVCALRVLQGHDDNGMRRWRVCAY